LLGVKWDTVWLIKQTLMEVMLRRNATYKLAGDVQIDDTKIAPGARVVSDGLACFGGVVETGMKHTTIVAGSGRPKDQRLKWTNTCFANIKGAITGTCRCSARRLFRTCRDAVREAKSGKPAAAR